jgi:hypothetical protein
MPGGEARKPARQSDHIGRATPPGSKRRAVAFAAAIRFTASLSIVVGLPRSAKAVLKSKA